MAKVEKDPKKKTRGKEKKGGLEIGDSGTQILKGIVHEEYNPKLRDVEGIKIYDEMRKSDGTVRAAMMAVTLPVRRAHWSVEPASEEASDIEITDFVSACLFELQSLPWDDFLRQALLSLPLGVMVFEKVFAVRDFNGQQRVIWDKLAPRLPKSIRSWETKTGEPGIQQYLQDGKTVDIPMEKLIVFTNEKEGDNYWGNSLLRAPYKHWYIKNNFYKIDAIAFERQGLGVPYAKMPESYTEEDRAKAEVILKNMRAHQMAFIIEPHDMEIGFKDMMARTTRDATASIMHHNREIVKSVLAQFLELGASESGSRALSEDQTDLFLQSLEAAGNFISDVMNKDAIKQLVDLNFDGVEHYPKLTCAGISRVDSEKIANAYTTLVGSGGMVAGEADERYFRELLGLPERDQSEDGEVDETKPEDTKGDPDEVIDELDMSEFADNLKKKRPAPTRAEIGAKIKASCAKLPTANALAFAGRCLASLERARKLTYHHKFFETIKTELRIEQNRLHVKLAEEGATFKSFRALTFAEEKVNFEALQKKLDQLEEKFDRDTQALLNQERERFIKALGRAVSQGDRGAAKAATIKAKNAYAKIVKDAMKEAFEYGKTGAAREMGVNASSNPAQVLAQIDIQADAIADLHISQISSAGKNALVDALNKGSSTAVAVAAADEIVEQTINELTRDTSRIVVSGYINNGRNTTFEDNEDKIYALQRSEILDSATCNYCLSVDGRIIEKDDPFGKNTIFHSGCRGIWVEIMLDETELPPIGGIPGSIRDRFGDAVNDLIQPKTPQTKKNTLARKEVERRLKRKSR